MTTNIELEKKLDKLVANGITELEKKSDGQAFVINNLVKAKDQLISRMAQLEGTVSK